MLEVRSETTAREESVADCPAPRLSLAWVWPFRRIDRLEGAELTLGRDDDVAFKISGSGVSRRHAQLHRQGPIYAVRDLGSTNGTWLQGRRVEHAPVAPGHVLRIGDGIGVFVLRAEGDAEFAEHAPEVFGGPEIARALEPVKRAAPSGVPVLLVGETGTGKERFARTVHRYSRRNGPFIALNCAALPEQLAEAELFGYRRGAFTGADRTNPGHFRAANQGTLFLDEMPELSLSLQAKLLRVLEDGQVIGLGDSAATPVDVRIVSASQKPLAELVSQGRLREDLAARLSGLQVRIPTLSERRADIAPLFAQFLAQKSGGHAPAVEARLIEALCLHDWTQNVRELELLTRTLLAVHGHEPTLKRQHLPPELAGKVQDFAASARPSSPPRPRREHDLEQVRAQLASNGGSVKAAAEALGISRQRIYRLLESKAVSSERVSLDPNADDDADS